MCVCRHGVQCTLRHQWCPASGVPRLEWVNRHTLFSCTKVLLTRAACGKHSIRTNSGLRDLTCEHVADAAHTLNEPGASPGN